jgi:hypothetical protein
VTESEERQRFEEWARGEKFIMRLFAGGDFSSSLTQGALLGWQARAALDKENETEWQKHIRTSGCAAEKCPHGVPIYCGFDCDVCKDAEAQPAEQKSCACVCHKVGLFGLMCCPCSTRHLDELVNGKTETSVPQPPAEQKAETCTCGHERSAHPENNRIGDGHCINCRCNKFAAPTGETAQYGKNMERLLWFASLRAGQPSETSGMPLITAGIAAHSHGSQSFGENSMFRQVRRFYSESSL